MNKITLIGIDTAKAVFHLVGVDSHGHYTWRLATHMEVQVPREAGGGEDTKRPRSWPGPCRERPGANSRTTDLLLQLQPALVEDIL